MPGLIAAGLTLVTARIGVHRPLEQSIYHALFHVRGEQSWDERVAVIEIDEASLAAMGQFPWPRHYYTELLKYLQPANVVAFDILFAESSKDDTALAAAMATHGNVVLATAWDEERGVIGPNASVVKGAIATGHIHYRVDGDGTTRAYQPKINDTLALSLLAVQRYDQKQPHTLSEPDSNQALWLNWPGEAHHAPRYSFVDVLTGDVPSKVFAEKMVFIGFTGEGLDAMITPYNQDPPAAGVYQHVVAANNLLAQNHLRPIFLPVWIIFAWLGALVSYRLHFRPMRVQLLAFLAIVAIWGGMVIVAFGYSYWLPTITPVMTIMLNIVLVRITERLCLRFKPLQWADDIGNMSFALRSSLKPSMTVSSDH